MQKPFRENDAAMWEGVRSKMKPSRSILGTIRQWWTDRRFEAQLRRYAQRDQFNGNTQGRRRALLLKVSKAFAKAK